MICLYILEGCPFCDKVVDWAEENKFDLVLKPISNEENLNFLLGKTGKKQVPYLVDQDNNVMMTESDDIIEYLKSISKKD